MKVRKPLQKDQLNGNPIHKEYDSSALMIADQPSQTAQYLYYNGELYYEYLGSALGTIADYRPLGFSQSEIEGFIGANMIGAGAGLSIDGSGDIQLGDGDTILFTPNQYINDIFDGRLTVNSRFTSRYENPTTGRSNFIDTVTDTGRPIFRYYAESPTSYIDFLIDTRINDLITYGLNLRSFGNNLIADDVISQDSSTRIRAKRTLSLNEVPRTDSSIEQRVQADSSGYNSFRLDSNNGAYDLKLNVTALGVHSATFLDSFNSKGLEYFSDYEANFTARSLVTKQWVESLGYLTSFTETDPTVPAWVKSITELEKANWNTAFSWGDHSVQGYATETFVNLAIDALTANNGVQRVGDNFSVDTTVIRTSGEQIKTGLLRYRFGGLGDTLVASYEYPDNSGEDYNLRLYSDAISNNVGYYWNQKFSLAINSGAETGVLDYPMIGFKNGILSIGSESYPLGTLGIETYYNGQTVPVVRNPLTLYVTGDSLFTGRIYAGKSDFLNTLFLTADDTFYSEGTVYARLGLRTRDAENLSILDGVAWDLGNYAVGTTLTQSHTAFVRIDGKLFKFALEEVV